MKHSKHSATGSCQTNNTNQSHSNSAENQSTLFRSKQFQYQTNQKNFVPKISFDQRHNAAISRKDTKGFKGGFIPTELKSSDARGRIASRENWHGSSDREETLSDPRWHKKPPNKGKKRYPEVQKSTQQEQFKQTSTPVRDANEILSTKKTENSKKSNFPEITFTKTNASGNRTDRIISGCNMTTTTTQTQSTTTAATTQTVTSEPRTTTTSSQTPEETKKIVTDIYVSRVDPEIRVQEVLAHNIEPPTMRHTLEASQEMITEELVATVEKTTNTVESEEDTPLFRQKLQRVLGDHFIAAATKKDRNLRPLINFVKKRNWEAIKASYGQYWYNIRNILHVREDCLLIDERIVIPTQLRQTVLDSLHLTHPGSAAMLDLSNHVWFPHMHRAIVQMAQNCKHCTEQGKNLKAIIGKKTSVPSRTSS